MGSKEGWAPATFKSSRQKRAKDLPAIQQQRPEDFMDEEDLQEERESQELATAIGFSGIGSSHEDSSKHDIFTDLLRPTDESMGVRLLKRMGWKEGQGIGPLIRRKAVLGDSKDDHDGTDSEHAFAPEDVPTISLSKKVDRRGLGFESELGIESGTTEFRSKTNVEEDTHNSGGAIGITQPKLKKNTRRKSGFGVGILNDTGSEDEDPYQMGPQISYNRTIGTKKKGEKKNKAGSQTATNPLLSAPPVFRSKDTKESYSLRKCHDGRPPLKGFVLSTEVDSLAALNLQNERYKPPSVPEGWTSTRQASQKDMQSLPYVSTADSAKASELDPKARARLLGETQLPGKSVFDYLTPAARERIVKASGNQRLPAALGETPVQGDPNTSEKWVQQLQDLVPRLDPEVAKQALDRGSRGWMPYAEDLEKQNRYRSFLSSQIDLPKKLPDRKKGMNKEDWAVEMNEFARAAQVFKPVSGLMATRFTTSAQRPRTTSDQPHTSVTDQELLARPAEKPEDAAVKAAQMGMFGPLTRSVKQFHPTKLLCKRFNVKPPDHVRSDGQATSGQGSSTQKTTADRFKSAGYQTHDATKNTSAISETLPQYGRSTLSSESKAVKSSSANLSSTQPQQHPMVDIERKEALEAERPGEAVFRAIFGSDDEND